MNFIPSAVWKRCVDSIPGLNPLLKVPETPVVSNGCKSNANIHGLLAKMNSTVATPIQCTEIDDFDDLHNYSLSPLSPSQRHQQQKHHDNTNSATESFVEDLNLHVKQAVEYSDVSRTEALADTHLPTPVVGFCTASGKKMKEPSAKALKKATDILNKDELTIIDISISSKINVNPSSEGPSIKDSPSLMGFSTASGKKVKPPSEESLLKASEIFQDSPSVVGFSTASGNSVKQLSTDQIQKASELFNETPMKPETFGFSSATGKTLKIPTTESLEKANSLFNEAVKKDLAFETPINKFKVPYIPSLKRQFNSQENTPVNQKRQKKFKTPFKTPPQPKSIVDIPKKADKKVEIKTPIVSRKKDRIPICEFFKGCIYQDPSFTFQPQISQMTLESAANFLIGEFSASKAHEILLGKNLGNDETLTPEWTKNHYAQIVWKLASLMRNFPSIWSLDARLISEQTIIDQLLHRFNAEVNECKRSIIKGICQRDQLSSRDMILCVSKIFPDSNQIELTDGWYTINAQIDAALQRAVKQNKIFRGLKLHIVNASQSSSAEACSPLDCRKSTLRICSNSARPAKWDSKMGLVRKRFSKTSLSAIVGDGGTVPLVDLVVLRQFPVAYVETLPDGTRQVLDAKEEYWRDQEYLKQRQNELERLLEEYDRAEEQELRRGCRGNLKLDKILDPKQIYLLVKSDPNVYQMLSSQQIHLFQRYLADQDVKKELLSQIDEKYPPRKRKMYMKLLVTDFCENLKRSPRVAFVKIWTPSEQMICGCQEGNRVFLSNLLPSNSGKYLHLMTSSTSRLIKSVKQAGLLRRPDVKLIPFHERLYSSLKSFFDNTNTFASIIEYIDIMGVVLTSSHTSNDMTNLFISDQYGYIGILQLKGRRFQQRREYSKLFETKQVVSALNVKFHTLDHRFGLAVFGSTDESEISVCARVKHQSLCNELLAFTNSKLFQQNLHKVQNQILIN